MVSHVKIDWELQEGGLLAVLGDRWLDERFTF